MTSTTEALASMLENVAKCLRDNAAVIRTLDPSVLAKPAEPAAASTEVVPAAGKKRARPKGVRARPDAPPRTPPIIHTSARAPRSPSLAPPAQEKKEKKEKKPRPATSYQCFMANERTVLKAEGWAGTPPQTMTEVARRWKALNDEDKKVWEQAAKEAREAAKRAEEEAAAAAAAAQNMQPVPDEMVEAEGAEEQQEPPKKKKKKKDASAAAASSS